MKFIWNDKEINLSGKYQAKIMNDPRIRGIGFLDSIASDVVVTEEEITFSKVLDKFGTVEATSYPKIESIKEYDSAIYVYCWDYYNNNKHQFVFYKA